MITFTRGDMFDRSADIRVNTVNCVGVMGAGVALAFKTRYPEMFRAYKRACDRGELAPGTLNVWRTFTEWIVNFPTKRHWREKSRYEDIEAGLKALREYLHDKGAVKVTLPALGCGHGGLDWARVSKMIGAHLDGIQAEVLVFEPADSVSAGDQAAALESPAPLSSAVEMPAGSPHFPGNLSGSGVDVVYLVGDAALFSRPWLFLATADKPDAREVETSNELVRAIARPGVVFLFRFGGPAKQLAALALASGADVLLWGVEGIDNLRPVPAFNESVEAGRLAYFSIAERRARWYSNQSHRVQALSLRAARATLVTDPAPEWLVPRLNDDHADVFCVRYSEADPALVESLRARGCMFVGRTSSTRKPNVDLVLAALRSSSADEMRVPAHVPSPTRLSVVPGGTPDLPWQVRATGAERASSLHRTQAEAIARAREMLALYGAGDLTIHGPDGRVRDPDAASPAPAMRSSDGRVRDVDRASPSKAPSSAKHRR